MSEDWAPPLRHQAPSKGLALASLIIIPLFALVSIAGVLQIAEAVAGVDFLSRREAFGVSTGLVLLRVVDLVFFRTRK